MLNDPRFHALSGRACKALLYLAGQYKGDNNGDLQAAQKLTTKAGWKSRSSLSSALRELERTGFIVKTRQGGRNRCNLYALSWFSIDECKGKLDISATRVAPNDWRKVDWSCPPVVQLAPLMVQSGEQSTSTVEDRTAHGLVRPETGQRLDH
jgi:hypothetical protein